jgi:hypothetical protein
MLQPQQQFLDFLLFEYEVVRQDKVFGALVQGRP